MYDIHIIIIAIVLGFIHLFHKYLEIIKRKVN